MPALGPEVDSRHPLRVLRAYLCNRCQQPAPQAVATVTPSRAGESGGGQVRGPVCQRVSQSPVPKVGRDTQPHELRSGPLPPSPQPCLPCLERACSPRGSGRGSGQSELGPSGSIRVGGPGRPRGDPGQSQAPGPGRLVDSSSRRWGRGGV